MTKIGKRALSVALVGVMTMSVFAGCSKTEKAADNSNSAGSTTAADNGSVYPMKKGAKLKMWTAVNTNWNKYAQNYGETEIAKELNKRTGVTVEYDHPPLGQEKDVFNVMIASQDLPDIIAYKWTEFPGGPSAAINNSVIIKLNDAINKWSPNLKNYLQKERPNFDKEAKMDDGSYYFYPMLRDGAELLHTAGPIYRKDWLDELGLSVPETTDEFYNAMKAFKDKKNAAVPFSTYGTKDALQCLQMLEGTFKTFQGFYIKDNKIQYGYMTPEYKTMMEYCNKLYKEGLLDKNFNSTDKKAQDSNMLNGKAGATYGTGGGNIGTWLEAAQSKDPKYDLVAGKFLVQKKGDKSTFVNYKSGMDNNIQAVITTKCKDVESAARFLDYGYSKEGRLVTNFGIEGKSYTMKDGKPTYTDIITKNPEKLSFSQALANWTNTASGGAALIQDVGYIEQFYSKPQQQNALKAWSDCTVTVMPLLTPTDEESSQMAKILNDANTYTMEMTVKFIMGTEPLSNFDKYVDNLKKMNIEKAIQLEQQALDRFNKR